MLRGSGIAGRAYAMSGNDTVYDAQFLQLLFRRLHRRGLDDGDAAGLSGMVEPVETLANRAAAGLAFDVEPADFLRVLDEQARGT